jgi:uncharacterized protein YjbI with pentapeptide repeats
MSIGDPGGVPKTGPSHVHRRKATCAVKMQNGEACGREIHECQTDTDAEPVCLMHSLDPSKDIGQFQTEFARILTAAKKENLTADFCRFVMPRIEAADLEFTVGCCFRRTHFTDECDFRRSTFLGPVDFTGATFDGAAGFRDALFQVEVDFDDSEFNSTADFVNATLQHGYFSGAKFRDSAHFTMAEFLGNAGFVTSEFEWADFSNARFKGSTLFGSAKFSGVANFHATRFAGDTDFSDASFGGKAEFGSCVFGGDADFRLARFEGLLSFEHTSFLGPTRFQELQFARDAHATFSFARIAEPSAVIFHKMFLGRTLLSNCDVSGVFFSNVEWLRRPNGRRMLFEEVVSTKLPIAQHLRTSASDGARDFDAIAIIYRQLKRNYEEQRDYRTAGDFYYGEMEMRRLTSESSRRWVKWIDRNLGLIAWYKGISEYGESYVRPMIWLIAVLLAFALLYPAVGLSYSPSGTTVATPGAKPTAKPFIDITLTYLNPWQDQSKNQRPEWSVRASLLCHSLVTSLCVASFQRDCPYAPSYPWGRVLSIVETLVTGTLVALFLLAVRREFRR